MPECSTERPTLTPALTATSRRAAPHAAEGPDEDAQRGGGLKREGVDLRVALEAVAPVVTERGGTPRRPGARARSGWSPARRPRARRGPASRAAQRCSGRDEGWRPGAAIPSSFVSRIRTAVRYRRCLARRSTCRSMTLPTGEQLLLAHGDQRAVVTEVGATLREYLKGGVAVVEGFERRRDVDRCARPAVLPVAQSPRHRRVVLLGARTRTRRSTSRARQRDPRPRALPPVLGRLRGAEPLSRCRCSCTPSRGTPSSRSSRSRTTSAPSGSP